MMNSEFLSHQSSTLWSSAAEVIGHLSKLNALSLR
jgi:hypothetical protein